SRRALCRHAIRGRRRSRCRGSTRLRQSRRDMRLASRRCRRFSVERRCPQRRAPPRAAALHRKIPNPRSSAETLSAIPRASGRIAMLDASELPPTYGIDPSTVRVIIAGGERAYFSAAEGAEDDEDAAIDAINRDVRADDAVIGIAASGTTPFTLAAVRRANML